MKAGRAATGVEHHGLEDAKQVKKQAEKQTQDLEKKLQKGQENLEEGQ